MRRLAMGVFCAALAFNAAWPSQARAPNHDLPPLFDASRIPYVKDNCRRVYTEEYLLGNFSRAFAVGSNGACGYDTGKQSPQQAEQDALAACARFSGVNCVVHSTNASLGGAAQARDANPNPITVGVLRADPTHFYAGPSAAQGVIVWAHGRTFDDQGKPIDLRPTVVPSIVRAMSNRGWDVLRFDRDPAIDNRDYIIKGMIESVGRLRQMGYQKVILGGHSLGGWSAMEAASHPSVSQDLYGVIAFAAARHGKLTDPTAKQKAMADFDQMVNGAAWPGQRWFVALFNDDPFDADPFKRSRMVLNAAARRGSPALAISPPPNITGHSGGSGLSFARLAGNCLVAFFESIAPYPEGCAAALRR